MAGRLQDKKIILGVSGGIAGYKACEVLRMLQREGAEVRVVMTAAAQKFVAPLTFETLSRYDVIKEMFPEHRTVKTRHVSWAEWADALLICPATANVIGKVASGIADDFLSTLIMAARRPVIFAPAMDYEMVQNAIYLDNVEKLKRFGYRFIPPQEGHLASGAQGPGRLADFRSIMEHVNYYLNGSDSLLEKRVLVTAGPTREAWDPVRFLTNRSSGKMGYAMAEAARMRGADVTLITGPTQIEAPWGVRLECVGSAAEMNDAVQQAWPQNDILIMAAAVADYRPVETSAQKIKKETGGLTLPLARTQDILAGLQDHGGLKVGFAVETEACIERAREKMQRKSLDMICLNNPLEAGAGFEVETNRVTVLQRDGKEYALPKMSKRDTASQIWDAIETRLIENEAHD